MIKTCSTGHNEVCWEHGNHPKGCPVCSQIKRFSDYYMDPHGARRDDGSENRDLTCKLRDANIEIEKWKMKGNEEFSTHMNSEKAMSEQIEKLKESIEISRNFAQHYMEEFEKMEIKWRQRGEEIDKLKKEILDIEDENLKLERGVEKLQGQLKASFDHRLSFKSIGPLENDEVDVMKDDYFKMKKQRDELLVEVQELKNASWESGLEFMLKRKVFELDSKIERLNTYNTELNTQNQQLRRDIRLIERAEGHGITKKTLDDLNNWARGYGAQG
jgi:SMC interacting uncharacterized protein involved in chromosome segregation